MLISKLKFIIPRSKHAQESTSHKLIRFYKTLIESSMDPMLSVVWAQYYLPHLSILSSAVLLNPLSHFPKTTHQNSLNRTIEPVEAHPRLSWVPDPSQPSATEGLLVMPISYFMNTITCNEGKNNPSSKGLMPTTVKTQMRAA